MSPPLRRACSSSTAAASYFFRVKGDPFQHAVFLIVGTQFTGFLEIFRCHIELHPLQLLFTHGSIGRGQPFPDRFIVGEETESLLQLFKSLFLLLFLRKLNCGIIGDGGICAECLQNVNGKEKREKWNYRPEEQATRSCFQAGFLRFRSDMMQL